MILEEIFAIDFFIKLKMTAGVLFRINTKGNLHEHIAVIPRARKSILPVKIHHLQAVVRKLEGQQK